MQKDRPLVSLPLLLLIAFSGTLGIHIFIPALPSIEADFGASSSLAQLNISIYIFGLALGQLVYGPASDRFGRRPMVFAGLAIYLLGSILSLLAPSIWFLIAARLLQSIGGAGGIALTRAIVGDMARGANATRQLALLNLLLLVAPGLAPILGAAIAELLGWRSVFGFLIAMAAVTILLSLAGLRETLPAKKTGAGSMTGDIRALFANRRFFAVSFGGSLAGTAASYAYFVSAPFILNVGMGLSPTAVGLSIGATLVAASLGTIMARYSAGRIAPERFLLVCTLVAGAAGLVFLAGAVGGLLQPASVITLSCIILFCAGGISPTAMATALALVPDMAGSAAGIYGFLQMMGGVLCSLLAGLGSNHAITCGMVLVASYGVSIILMRNQSRARGQAATPDR